MTLTITEPHRIENRMWTPASIKVPNVIKNDIPSQRFAKAINVSVAISEETEDFVASSPDGK
jgi:hypothetical protein